mgnify:CR=1 FL=1
MNKFIPVNTPLLDGSEWNYLQKCIETGWISSEGPFVQDFEQKFARLCGRKHAVSVSSGSAALEIAVHALEIKKGDEVILPTFTIISCVAPLIRIGAIPVLVDADPLTWNMDVSQIEQRITSRTKAIMAVHIYGLPVNMDPLLKLAKRYKLLVIEDAAEAHGLLYKDKICGSLGDISTFSFYPNKLITTGEGGMAVTDDDRIAEKCRSLRNLCFQKNKRFIHEELGWNFRMTNIQAALGLAQIKRLDEFINKKRRMGQKYSRLLKSLDCVQIPTKETNYSKNIYWVFGLVLNEKFPKNADSLMKKLKKCGIGTRPFFWPIHKQPVIKKLGLLKTDTFPVAERIAKKGFYIPSGLGLTNSEINRVSSELLSILD